MARILKEHGLTPKHRKGMSLAKVSWEQVRFV